MATLTTKYSIGDVVWYATTIVSQKQHACPDCLGTREWAAKSPAGGEYKFACPRCASSYQSDRDLSLNYSAHEPYASRLTIGSVKVNTDPSSYDGGNSYMCVETGIGSGSIYREDRLFETETEALAAAKAMADLANAETVWIVTQFNKTLSFSDYQLDNLKIKTAKDDRRQTQIAFSRLDYLFSEISEAADKEAIVDLVDWYRRYDWDEDKDRIAALGKTEAAA